MSLSVVSLPVLQLHLVYLRSMLDFVKFKNINCNSFYVLDIDWDELETQTLSLSLSLSIPCHTILYYTAWLKKVRHSNIV